MQQKYQDTPEGFRYFLKQELHRYLGDDLKGWRFLLTLETFITETIKEVIAEDLGIKLIHSQTTSSYYSARKNAVNPPLRCVMIFDTKANRFIGNQGYVAVDVPPRGQVARFSTYLARYVGTAR